MTRPIAILHIHGRMGRGGAELRNIELLRNIDRRRYRFDFCALSQRHGELDEEIRALDARVYRIRAGRRDFAQRFRELLRQGNYDVVHSHVHHRSGYLLRLAAGGGVPVRIAHFRNSRDQRCGTPARRLARSLLSPFVERYAGRRVLCSWIDRYATDILGVSQGALDSAWSPNWRSDRRCRVVYDGLDPDRFRLAGGGDSVRREFGIAQDAPLLIHVGRTTPEKNHRRLLSIFRALCDRRPSARLLAVSRAAVTRDEKAVEKSVRRRVKELNLAGRVIFSGERTDVPRLMRAAELLLFPSLHEGLGDVVLEACASGTPALCSDLPSIREIAERLPEVYCLPLCQPDTRWAEVAAALADRRPANSRRKAALELFAESEFTVERSLKVLCAIWRRGREETALHFSRRADRRRVKGGAAHG